MVWQWKNKRDIVKCAICVLLYNSMPQFYWLFETNIRYEYVQLEPFVPRTFAASTMDTWQM